MVSFLVFLGGGDTRTLGVDQCREREGRGEGRFSFVVSKKHSFIIIHAIMMSLHMII